MNEKQKQTRRNNSARLLVIADRRWVNTVRFNTGSTAKHEMFKALECFHLQEQGHDFITEARFENGGGRCDILDLDLMEVIEIVMTESEESIMKKQSKYPVPIRIVRVK